MLADMLTALGYLAHSPLIWCLGLAVVVATLTAGRNRP